MSIVSSFRDFLIKESFHMEEIKEKDGVIYFKSEQTIDNGGSVTLVIVFNSDESIVDINAFNIAKINNPLKRDNFLDLINELNLDYRFPKFYETQGTVSATYSMTISPNFSPNTIFDTAVMVYQASAASFPKFMKLVWS